VRIVDITKIKSTADPIKGSDFAELIRPARHIITVADASPNILEGVVYQAMGRWKITGPTVTALGIPGFVESAFPEKLYAKYGFDEQGILKKTLSVLSADTPSPADMSHKDKPRSEMREMTTAELPRSDFSTPTQEIRPVATRSNAMAVKPWQILRLRTDVIAVVEQSKIDALSPEMFKELLEIAGLNNSKLHLVIPDALQGKYSQRVAELRKVTSVYYGFPQLAASDKIPVIGFSDMEHDTLMAFQRRLDPRLAGRVKDSAFGLNQAGSFGVGILYALKDILPDQLLPNQNGFRYDRSGWYSAQVLEALQAYAVISTSA
jgi:hypothetical protein